ncbi:hypothetical protein VWZ82_13110 [Phaeobacter sp. JH20_41]|uniref:hypothetical protein n=1 Tax=Phaeobacter sp. JH20_41 TaxID=3112498 RepID=UPI003A8461EC
MQQVTAHLGASGIEWRSDMENAPRDGSDFLAWFPLEGLGPSWCRCVPIYWSERDSRWNFSGRAASGFSRGFQPTHWADITPPDPE